MEKNNIINTEAEEKIMDYKDKIYDVWEELSISNDFLFGKVMQDAQLCRELLQRILP